MKVRELRRLQYDPALVPVEGLEVCCEFAAPAKREGKDAAGHAFHAFALKQSGFLGECMTCSLPASSLPNGCCSPLVTVGVLPEITI